MEELSSLTDKFLGSILAWTVVMVVLAGITYAIVFLQTLAVGSPGAPPVTTEGITMG